MNPDLMGALARQRTKELRRSGEIRDTQIPRRHRLEARDGVRRARRFLGLGRVSGGRSATDNLDPVRMVDASSSTGSS